MQNYFTYSSPQRESGCTSIISSSDSILPPAAKVPVRFESSFEVKHLINLSGDCGGSRIHWSSTAAGLLVCLSLNMLISGRDQNSMDQDARCGV